MKNKPLIEWIIYAAILVLSAIVIALVVSSPPDFTKSKPVYGGF
ncbi:MAG TPA: hypothetical protein VK742_15585 [Candidatus Sulfotelmatobacter sp.]|jgi:hypothetical protein|nr:hypothetical protein [Candidatus Sulfotelmatobacter sp.]